MVQVVLDLFLEFVVGLVMCIAVHEIGHQAYFRFALKREVELKFNWRELRIETGTLKDYAGLTGEEHGALALSGVIVGFLPLLFISNHYVVLLVTGAYIMGIKRDLTIIWRQIQAKRQQGGEGLI